MNRRQLLKSAPLAAVPWLAGRAGGEPAPPLITRMHEPRNLETPVGALAPEGKLVTANDAFYVRSHFAMPKIDMATWTLKVEGHVEKPAEYSFDQLSKLPQSKKTITLECAGNGRVFLTPAVRGLQWGFGGVGTAEWEGAALAEVLQRAVPKAGAVEVILVGADAGAINSDPPSPGPIPFDRSIPLDKAMKPETILATRMNGEALTPAHGYPVRAVVGGYFGMAAVKWLTRIIVAEKPYAGFFQTIDYSIFERRGGLASLKPVAQIQPKAIITSHESGQAVAAGQPLMLHGLAWSGERAVAKVEVSTDGGTTWAVAEMPEQQPNEFAWVKWRYEWKQPQGGIARVVARCTDVSGNTQPEKRDPDRRTYAINHLVPIELTVK